MGNRKHKDGLGVQSTVGDTIVQLFPKGFLVQPYLAREALRVALETVKADCPERKKSELTNQPNFKIAADMTFENSVAAESRVRDHMDHLAKATWK